MVPATASKVFVEPKVFAVFVRIVGVPVTRVAGMFSGVAAPEESVHVLFVAL